MFCCVHIPATRTGAYWGMVSFCIVLGVIGAALFIIGSVVVSKSGDPVKGYVMAGIGFVVGSVAVGTLAYVEQERTRRFIIQQAAAAANGSNTTTAAIPIPNSSSRDAPPSAAAIDVTDSMTPVMGTAIGSQPRPQSYAPHVVMLQPRPQTYAVVPPPQPVVLMAQPQPAVVVTRPLYQPYPPTRYVVTTSQPAMATAVYVQQPQPTTMVYTTVRQF